MVACRAAIYASLVPTDQFRPANGPEEKRDSLARANAARFLERLCVRAVAPKDMATAAAHIRDANGGQTRRVLDQFAGGGSIPLEAARLGCEAHALELNPVAYLVELATLVYPVKFGSKLTGAVRRWSQVVFERTKAEVGDLYPLVPDPRAETRKIAGEWQSPLKGIEDAEPKGGIPRGYLKPVAYIWTRTVPCRNCNAVVPLHRQTWLRKKSRGFVALRPVADDKEKRVRYERLESTAGEAAQAVAHWNFDPTSLSTGGETECPFCLSAVPTEHVKVCGKAGTMGTQLMAVVAVRDGERGKAYLPAGTAPGMEPDEAEVRRRLEMLLSETGLTLPTEPIFTGDSRAFFSHLYGLMTFADHFTTRQLVTLLTFVKHVRAAHEEMVRDGMDADMARAIVTYLAFVVNKMAERGMNSVGAWDNTLEVISRPVSEGKMPMVWDFGEANPFSGGSGSWEQAAGDVADALQALAAERFTNSCTVQRGSALALPYESGFFDTVITDPPYYDNVPYSYLADFFYVWLKRSVGHLYPEHFASATSPFKSEAVMDPSRHGGNKEKAKEVYETMMAQAFTEAHRVLKPGGIIACVYAHKTTAGWATLVDALRRSGFIVTEAWPLDTENSARQRSKDSAALASSIFLVARKRDRAGNGSYEDDVRPELERIVRERVETLWEMGISGADLVIAAVGAGLRAFTQFGRVEYANGEEVPAGRFLAEVEGVVLETLLEKIFDVPRSSVAAVDGPSRFYVLWRYTYKAAELDAGEAIVFTYGQGVEMDGPRGLSSGSRALVEKKKGKYRLRDFTERGANDRLGLSADNGPPAPLVDVLHRIVWLAEHEPRSLTRFLDQARPDRERLRLVAQALAGAGLKGKSEEDARLLVTTTASEQAALAKLLANWRALIEAPAMPLYDRRGEA